MPLKVDGRKARAVKTRERILSALVELIDSGNPSPTAAQIAHRAKVAVRSIAQHFRTREQLLLATAEAHLGRINVGELPDASTPLPERLERFAMLRGETLERSASMRLAAMMGASGSRAVTGAMEKVAEQRRQDLRNVFKAELEAAPRWTSSAAEAVTSGAFWDELRRDQKLPKAAALEAMREALAKVLGA
ncbi:MAG: TetR family transcriptional regulator [Myxococcaceae bacterium]